MIWPRAAMISSGEGGAIRIDADHMQLTDGALVAADTISTGRGGRLDWTLGSLDISDSRVDLTTRDIGAGAALSFQRAMLARTLRRLARDREPQKYGIGLKELWEIDLRNLAGCLTQCPLWLQIVWSN